MSSAMATGTLQLASCVKCKENSKTTNSSLYYMITKIAFGSNNATEPDLTGLMLGCDRGHVLREFIAKIIDCGSRIYSTLKHYPWIPITCDQNVSEKDN